MLRGIAWILGVLLVVGGCWWLYNSANGRAVPTNGDVFMRTPPQDSPNPADTPPQPDTTATPSPSHDRTVQTAPAPTPIAAPAAQPATSTGSTTSTPQIPTPQSVTIAKPSAALPIADTIAPNPPNGTAFAGSGKYQWYRQGNLTWRVDTQSGTTCIAFATDEEWRKPRVLSHGCGSR